MATFNPPPTGTSILAYAPFFPNGQVNDAWNTWFTSLSDIIIAGPVQSFNGRTGLVYPTSGDYPASLIPFTEPITGALATTLDWKAQDSVSLFDFLTPTQKTNLQNGTVPDLTTPIQTAINGLNIGQTLLLPPGNFATSSVITINKGIRILGAGTKGTETTFNQHSQWTIANTGIGIQIDPSFVSGVVDPISKDAEGAWGTQIENVKFQSLAGSVPAIAAVNQICINLRYGWLAQVINCDFRNIATAIGLNGCWSARFDRNTFNGVGYCFREDPDFALAGYTVSGGLNLYQANNIVITNNIIVSAVYGLYFYGPFHQISVHDNVIQNCSQLGIMAASYNGSLSTTGTDLVNHGDSMLVQGNYLELDATAIQLGKSGTGAQSTSAPRSCVIMGNFNTFQGAQTYNLSVLAAVDCIYKYNRSEAYSTVTPDINLDSAVFTARCEFESINGWNNSFNGDTTSTIRRADSTYRGWSSFTVNPSSGSKITATTLWSYNAGTSALPFDSIATLRLFLQNVLRYERAMANVSTDTVTATLFPATYSEVLTFDNANSGVHTFLIVPDGSATANSIIFTGLNVAGPYYLGVSGSGTVQFNVNPATLNPNQIYGGGKVYLDSCVLKYASAGAASTKGFLVYQNGELTLSNVSNFDANLPYYGMAVQGGTIYKNGTTPSGSNSNENATQGGLIRGDTTLDYANVNWQNTTYQMSNANPQFYFGSGSGTPTWQFRGAAATARWFQFNTNTTARAAAGIASDSESGSDAGSTYRIRLYSDAGAFNYDAFIISRTVNAPNQANNNWKFSGYIGNAVGGSVSSAATITPTGQIFHVTGTTTINTINLPYVGFTGTLVIIPDGVFATGTSGNIAIASTSVVSKALRMTYDGTKWYPSY